MTARARMTDGLWVRSDVLPDGSYGVAINVGDDRAWTLNRDQAIAYAVACFTRATEAEHDAAVIGLLTATGMELRTAGAVVVKDLRPDRPDDDTATKPLRFIPSYGANSRRPFLVMQLDGLDCGELTTADLRDHAQAVLQCLAAVDLDAAFYRHLTGPVGLGDGQARAVIGGLADHWPAVEQPRTTA